jgi:hypothetical protein
MFSGRLKSLRVAEAKLMTYELKDWDVCTAQPVFEIWVAEAKLMTYELKEIEDIDPEALKRIIVAEAKTMTYELKVYYLPCL